MSQVAYPLRLVVPISLTRIDEQLHRVLWGYKNSAVDEVRDRFSIQIAALLARFLASHRSCIATAAGYNWDTVTIVPSTRERPGGHPLAGVLDMVKVLRGDYQPLLQPGSAHIDHNQADDAGFTADVAAEGRRVLLVDDTFTSGARLQSAASALRLSGAEVVAGLVVGRVISPEWNAPSKALWDKARRIPYSFDRCCLDWKPDD